MSAEPVQLGGGCGRCQAADSSAARAIANRPGLSRIEYRVGDYARFLRAMTEQIARTPELREKWLTRSTEDFGVALVAMWAYLADILTFYQERIANEAFVRTALLQESVLGLATLLNYKPSPGAAAEADLAFIAEQGKQVRIPASLRVQSVPGQDEKPQKFETVESITAHAELNQVPIFPNPTLYNPFKTPSSEGVLLSDPKGLAPQVKLALFNSKVLELKEVSGLSIRNSQQSLGWTPPVQSAGLAAPDSQMVVYSREFRLFGHNAPSSYVQAVKDDSAAAKIRLDLVSPPYTPPDSANRLALDAVYGNLKPGTDLVISQSGSFVCLVSITSVSTEPATYGPLQGTVTWITLSKDCPPIDRSKVTIYEVTRLLKFSPYRYADSISGAVVCVPLAKMTKIDEKRSLILDDAAADPQTVRVESVEPVDTDEDGQPDHWRLSFAPELRRPLATASAILYGNVCAATHGQTIADEVLGDGDAAAVFQSFRLQKSPVTFVRQAGAPHGVANTLQIQTSGVIWKEVQDFFGHGPTERIFVTSQDATAMTVKFGDGVTASRLPSGRGNIVALYRQGMGHAGNVAKGSLRTLLDRPVGLKSVTNPGAADGGADPESPDETRANAPNTVRTFGRIVSLEDFQDAAREIAGVAKAYAFCAWNGEEEVVYLTVGGVQGAAFAPKILADLVAALNVRRDPNRSLVVQNYTKIKVQMAAVIFVSADYVPDAVLAAAHSAVLTYFSFDNQQFGHPVHLSSVYAALQAVEGIAGADITALNYKDPAVATARNAASGRVQPHLRIYGEELAVIDNASRDVLITIG